MCHLTHLTHYSRLKKLLKFFSTRRQKIWLPPHLWRRVRLPPRRGRLWHWMSSGWPGTATRRRRTPGWRRWSATSSRPSPALKTTHTSAGRCRSETRRAPTGTRPSCWGCCRAGWRCPWGWPPGIWVVVTRSEWHVTYLEKKNEVFSLLTRFIGPRGKEIQ